MENSRRNSLPAAAAGVAGLPANRGHAEVL
jgi:hypothetical protein